MLLAPTLRPRRAAPSEATTASTRFESRITELFGDTPAAADGFAAAEALVARPTPAVGAAESADPGGRTDEQLLADHRAGVADNSRKVWAVAMFCLWHAIEIERTINPAPSDVYRPRLRHGAPSGHIAAA